MNTLDTKRLEGIRDSLYQYSANQITLRDLITNIEILSSGLELISENWRKVFYAEWGVLEEIYSVSVVRERRISIEEQQHLILPAISKMKQLIDEVLEINPQANQ